MAVHTDGKELVYADDAVDEAICFGWIDSKPNSLDERRSIQFFAPRKPTSNWSKLMGSEVRLEKFSPKREEDVKAWS